MCTGVTDVLKQLDREQAAIDAISSRPITPPRPTAKREAVTMAQETATAAAAAHAMYMSKPSHPSSGTPRTCGVQAASPLQPSNLERKTIPVTSSPLPQAPKSPVRPATDTPRTGHSAGLSTSDPNDGAQSGPAMVASATQATQSVDNTVPVNVIAPSNPATTSTAAAENSTNTPGASASAAARTNAPPNVPSTPFISYAHQSGLLSHLPPSQPSSLPVVPTFHREWAHVASEETRPVREDLLVTKQSSDHTRLVASMLGNNHEWYPVPVNNMSYKYYVENDRDDVRPNLARFKIMMIQYKETAQEAWSKFVESRHWWIVPPTLHCDRTLYRDAFDCYYVDAWIARLQVKMIQPSQSAHSFGTTFWIVGGTPSRKSPILSSSYSFS